MAYKVGSTTVINDSGKLTGLDKIDGVSVSGATDKQALVYNASSGTWEAGAGGKTIMKIYPTTGVGGIVNPTQFSACNAVTYEVTTDSLLQGQKAENIIFLLNDTQVANIAYASFTNQNVGGDTTVQRHYQSLDLSSFSTGQTATVTAYAIDGVNNVSNTITVATTSIIDPTISTPTNVSPTNGAGGQSLSVTLTSSTYSTIGSTETHASSDWQVSTTSGFTSGFAHNVTNDTTNKTSFPTSGLGATVTYYWRVRYKSATLTSNWSTGTSFTTLAAVGSDGQSYSGGTIANNGISVVYASPGSYTFTIPQTSRIVATVVGAGGGGGANGQPSHGGGGGGGVRAVRTVTPGQTATVVVGARNPSGSLSTGGNASGQASSVTYSSSTITGGGGQATDNPANQYYAYTAGGTTSVGPGWQALYNQNGGRGGTGDGDPSYTPQSGGQGYAGGGGGGFNWSNNQMNNAPGGQGQGWWGGGGGGNGSHGYPGSPGSQGSGGTGNPAYGTNAQGRGYPGGSGSPNSPGQPGLGPAGGSGGPGQYTDPTPSHSGAGGGGSYGGGGGNTQGWFGGGAQGAGGYVRFDWGTGE